MFGQSNHPREGVESVHSLPILLPLLKTELVCGNRLRTTAQAVYKKASLIVTSYILSKYRGATTSRNRQISSKRLLLNCTTWQNNAISRLYDCCAALAPLFFKSNDVCLSPDTRFILKVPRFVTTGDI